MIDNKLFKDLKDNIDNIEIFDTHEHIMYDIERKTKKIDFFILFYFYTDTDLVSSGLKRSEVEKLLNPNISLKVKWNIFSPYWEFIKNTTDGKIIKIVLKDIFGVENIDLYNIEKVTKKINEFKEMDYYKYILREKSKIVFILNDIDNFDIFGVNIVEPDKDYFLPVIRLDHLLELNSAESFYKIEEKNNIEINNFSDFIELIDKKFEERKNKIYALKSAIAYSRDLFFDEVTYNEAEKSFIKVLKLNNYDNRRNDCISLTEIRPFQDFMYHYLVRKAIEYNLPIQIHTGMLDGNGNDIRNSNPTHLSNLILKYKKAKFDIFHLAYPYTNELIAMVKMYPNCFINMCLIPQVSKYLYKNTLNLLIDIIPSNKIFGFGGDYLFVEGTYAAQKIAREAIAEVLYERVLNNYFSFDNAVKFAERILGKNAKSIYL